MPGISSNGSLEIPEPLVLEKCRAETIQGRGEGGSTFSFFAVLKECVGNTFSAYSVSATGLKHRCLKGLVLALRFMSNNKGYNRKSQC